MPSWLTPLLATQVAIVLIPLELAAIAVLRRRRPWLPRTLDLLLNAIAGLCLLLTVLLALQGGPPAAMLASLAGAGVAHAADLVRQARRIPP